MVGQLAGVACERMLAHQVGPEARLDHCDQARIGDRFDRDTFGGSFAACQRRVRRLVGARRHWGLPRRALQHPEVRGQATADAEQHPRQPEQHARARRHRLARERSVGIRGAVVGVVPTLERSRGLVTSPSPTAGPACRGAEPPSGRTMVPPG